MAAAPRRAPSGDLLAPASSRSLARRRLRNVQAHRIAGAGGVRRTAADGNGPTRPRWRNLAALARHLPRITAAWIWVRQFAQTWVAHFGPTSGAAARAKRTGSNRRMASP